MLPTASTVPMQSRLDQRGRVHLGDDRRAGDHVAGAQLGAVVDDRRAASRRPSTARGRAAWRRSDRRCPRASRGAGSSRAGPSATARRFTSSCGAVHVEGEQPQMLGIEAVGHAGEAIGLQRLGVDRQRHFERLALIAHVDFELAGDVVGGDAFGGEFGAGLRGHFVQDRQRLALSSVSPTRREKRACGFGAHPRGRIAQRAQHAGARPARPQASCPSAARPR